MNDLVHLLGDLAAGLPADAADPSGTKVIVTAAELELPLEARIEASGLRATLPRGRLATGFWSPLGRMRACFTRPAGDPAGDPVGDRE